jgi:TIR domain
MIDALFDALVSPERHGLESWPEVMGTVSASWMDADGNLYRVGDLDELREAYEAFKTYSVGFTCFGGDLLTSSFSYRPGAQPPTAEADVQGPPVAVEAAIRLVQAVFPNPPSGDIVFLSWSGDVARRVAAVLQKVFQERLPGASVFLSSTSIEPGEPPMRMMLHENLRKARAVVAVLTQESANRPWVVWETASAWGRGATVIPVFVDIRPSEVEGPLTTETQGIRYNDRAALDQACAVLARAARAAEPEMLTDEQFAAILAAASDV